MSSNPLLIKQKMGLRKLAKQFRSVLETTSSKRILVTSVQGGDGKAKFINELHAELRSMGEPTFVALEGEKLYKLDPHKFDDHVVVVYGPAYLETFGLHMLPEKWLNAFDAAVVIVMVRSTTSNELVEMLDWLKEYNIEHIWLVWNEHNAPPVEMIWPMLKRRLTLGRMWSDTREQLAAAARKARDSWLPLQEKIERLRPASLVKQLPQNVAEKVDDNVDTSPVVAEEDELQATAAILSEGSGPPDSETVPTEKEEHGGIEPVSDGEQNQVGTADTTGKQLDEEAAVEEDADGQEEVDTALVSGEQEEDGEAEEDQDSASVSGEQEEDGEAEEDQDSASVSGEQEEDEEAEEDTAPDSVEEREQTEEPVVVSEPVSVDSAEETESPVTDGDTSENPKEKNAP